MILRSCPLSPFCSMKLPFVQWSWKGGTLLPFVQWKGGTCTAICSVKRGNNVYTICSVQRGLLIEKKAELLFVHDMLSEKGRSCFVCSEEKLSHFHLEATINLKHVPTLFLRRIHHHRLSIFECVNEFSLPWSLHVFWCNRVTTAPPLTHTHIGLICCYMQFNKRWTLCLRLQEAIYKLYLLLVHFMLLCMSTVKACNTWVIINGHGITPCLSKMDYFQ